MSKDKPPEPPIAAPRSRRDLLAMFTAAVAAAKVPYKDGQNPKFKNRYIKLEDLLVEVKAALTSAGFILSSVIDYDAEKQSASVEHFFRTVEGDELTFGVQRIPIFTKAPQDFGSATTYLARYSLSRLFNIEVENDDDAEAAMGRNADRSQRQPEPSKGESSAHVEDGGTDGARRGPDAQYSGPGGSKPLRPARPPGEPSSGPLPPSGGLAASNISGLRKVSRDHETEPADSDEMTIEEIRALPTLGGRTLGALTEKQLRQMVDVEAAAAYIAKALDMGKREVALANIRGAKVLLADLDSDDMP